MNIKIKPVVWLKKYDIRLIMFLAFLVRMIGFRWMDYTNFPEFYRDYYTVSGISHGQLMLLGPPSMLHGFHFGPFYYYSMLPFFLLFGGHPFSLIFTGIVFSVLTVYAFFRVLLLWFNSRTAALVGALFVALSVYSLHLSSYVSNPNFLPLFVLWYFYYLTKVLTTKKRSISSIPEFGVHPTNIRNPEPSLELDPGSRMHSAGMEHKNDYVFLGLAFGLATQLHATAMIVLPLVTLTALILHKYRPQFKTFGIFLLAVVFTYLPYLFYEFTHGFVNFRRLFILGAKELDGTHYTSGLAAIWNFFEGTLTPFNFWYSYSIIQPNILYLIIALFAAIALVAILYRIFKKPRPEQNNFKISKIGMTIVLAWTLITCTVLLLFARGVHDHYIIILWPMPIIILTYAVFWIKTKFNVFTSLMALIIVTSLLQIYSFYQFGHTPWSEFMPVYQSKYQNAAGVSEIGS
jgi:4-amino-4-deoxy-L-arabinose transferase-like glycosyltransferase